MTVIFPMHDDEGKLPLSVTINIDERCYKYLLRIWYS
jgi:hypothetical protein